MQVVRLDRLEPRNEEGIVCVVVETPKGHRNKYRYDEELGAFTLGGVLTAGAVFPFDFGFIPSTKADDGDPIDVLVLMDESAYPGIVVEVRLLGVIKAQQTGKGEDNRNDRLIAVHEKSHLYKNIKEIEDLPKSVIEEITHFFVSYNRIKGVEFKPLGAEGRAAAEKLLDRAIERHGKESTRS